MTRRVHDPSGRRLHIVHVITGLGMGGAEMMLYKVLTRMDPSRYTAEVVSLSRAADLRPRIEALSVPVASIDMAGPAAAPAAWLRLRALLKRQPAAVVQTWMYHADLLGGLAARSSRLPVVWNVQGSNLDARTTRRRTRAIVAGCARLSRLVPARIVICGPATARIHVTLGYAEDRVVVIPNAVDSSVFRPDPDARDEVRRELGLPHDAFVVGVGARFDPQKDHRTLLDAWARLRRRGPASAHLVLFGSDVTAENPQLDTWMREFGAPDVHLLGPRSDVARLFAACDISCLSSAYGEGLPNAVAEAMACGLPCVVTDVGDSGWVVGATGVVVPPRDPERLAAGLETFASASRERLQAAGLDARRRVEEHFELGDVAARYYALYDEVCAVA